MTAADARASDIFMRDYKQWERDVATWDIYVHGAAPYWGGPKPRRPGAPPAPPKITNTACQAATAAGVAAIYTRITRALAAMFRCEGDCSGGQRCVQKFVNSRGTGFSYTEHETFCIFTVRGRCECDFVEVSP